MTRVVGIRDTIQDYCLNQFYYCCIVKLAYLLPNTHTTRILMISLKKKNILKQFGKIRLGNVVS